MKKYSLAVAMLFMVIAVTGCGGGGDGDSGGSTPAPPVARPAIQVLPATYDFGKVTASNSPAPLEVTIKNNGTAALNVSTISFGVPSDSSFTLGLNGGSKPCGSGSPTVAVADSCTFQVRFQPAGTGSFAANLQISSDDRSSPLIGLSIAGTSEPVAALSVRINQLETACPTNEATAYVSVTDQGGYPVPGLQLSNFSITEENVSLFIKSFSSVDVVYKPIAIAAVMDYSGSLTDQPVAIADMKNGFSSLFSSVRANDIGEIVKFGSEFEVVQPFTSDKAALLAAISAPFDKGSNTRLYDAVFQAVDDTAVNANYRRAVIVATDGEDAGPTAGVPFSNRSLVEVINNAVNKKVPIFTIGLGASVNRAVLEQMATTTGGLFYEANTSQNLANIYQQLSSILYEKQYTLTFNQLVRGVGSRSNLAVGANFLGLTGNAVTTITSCN
jgi:Ca-activated chloride channel family protein